MATVWVKEKKEQAIATIIDRICEGESLRSILMHADRSVLPSVGIFLKWVSEDKDLEKQYARAMEIRSDLLFDEIFDIADEANADIDITDDGKIRVIGEAVQRSRLRVDARKWALSKMQPKKYGDKIDIDHSSSDGTMSQPTTIVFTRGSKEGGKSGSEDQ